MISIIITPIVKEFLKGLIMKKLLLILGSIASINAFANGKITYGNGNFYFLSGDNRYFYKLSNDFSIKQKYQTAGAHENIQSTVYANNSIEAVGTDNPDYAFKVSNDLKVTASLLKHDLYDVSYVNGKYTTVGDGIYSSLDGLTWSPEYSPNGTYKSIAYGNGRYVAVGDGVLSASKDQNTNTWQTMPGIDSTSGLNKIVYGNGTFVAVGNSRHIYYSLNGTSWNSTNIQGGNSDDIKSVAYCPSSNTFVAVGSKMGIYTSQNGISWQQTIVHGTGTLFDVSCNQNGRIVAVGEDTTIISSFDGYNWHSSKINVDDKGTFFWVEHSTDNSSFLAAGNNGFMYTSLDGETWNELHTEAVKEISTTTLNPKPTRISQTTVRFW